ncbi:MAG TPA: hypothetical protein VMD55_05070 [Terracidiphilus sp.]|nr:hypothetical protein [Terracidiphilus sp.]
MAILALLAAMAQGRPAVWAQAAANPAGAGQTAPPTYPKPYTPRPATSPYTGAQPYTPRPATSPYTGAQPYTPRPAASASGAQNLNHPPAAAASPEDNTPTDEPTPQITIATPAPAAAPWLWPDRIAWIARIVLFLFGCVGVYIGLSLLRKIDRQTQYAETAAQSAALSAQAALLHAQAIVRSERPWILVTVEPSGKVENRFMIVATNRGRGPARILSAVEKITTEIDQSSLPPEPDYEDAETNESLDAVILLPGESTGIKSFGRDDVREFCVNEEQFKRVERWEEVILLYGKIVYEDLVDLGNVEPCQTAWCCWYIHGRQNSGMVMAGPPAYNRHT